MEHNEQEKSRLDADHDVIQRLLDNDIPGVSREDDEDYAIQLLDRLQELGVIQVCDKWQCILFNTIHNARPLIMFDMEMDGSLQFERVLPIHIYETVNKLMWQRLLEPKLALAYKGLFDFMPAGKLGFALSYTLSDSAHAHLSGLL